MRNQKSILNENNRHLKGIMNENKGSSVLTYEEMQAYKRRKRIQEERKLEEVLDPDEEWRQMGL